MIPDGLDVRITGLHQDPTDPDRLWATGTIPGILQRRPLTEKQLDRDKVSGEVTQGPERTVKDRRGRVQYDEPELRTVSAWYWVSAVTQHVVHKDHAENNYIYPDSKMHPAHPDKDAKEVCRCAPREMTIEESGEFIRNALYEQNKQLIGTTINLPQVDA